MGTQPILLLDVKRVDSFRSWAKKRIVRIRVSMGDLKDLDFRHLDFKVLAE